MQLAQAAGLELDNGIACDEYLQTSAENVYAAGDVANPHIPCSAAGSGSNTGPTRVTGKANARNQAPAAARNMLGRGEAYERVPYFFSSTT